MAMVPAAPLKLTVPSLETLVWPEAESPRVVVKFSVPEPCFAT